MRIALYIEDGLEQVVLTPESETERGILEKLNDGSRDLAIRHGQFFHCQGGYVHQNHGERSTMIVLTPAKSKEPKPASPRVLPGDLGLGLSQDGDVA